MKRGVVIIAGSLLYPTHTISLFEIFRLVVGLVGIVFGSLVALRSMVDLEWLRASKKNGIRQYSAITYFRIHATIVLVQWILLGNTIVAMTQPTIRSKTGGIIGNILIILAIILLTIMSTETDRRKNNLYEMLEEIDA